MDGYISKAEALNYPLKKENRDKAHENPHFGYGIDSVLEYLKELPTSDVAPIIHGKWIINTDGYYPYCSDCYREPKNGEMTNYCPNCGAKMSKE